MTIKVEQYIKLCEMWLKKFVTFSIVKWRSKKLGNRETKSKNSSSKLSVQANHRHG